MKRTLLLLGLVAALTGYFGPWVDHRAAGLVITGLDLGETVKFLPSVRSGEVLLWRPGFYAPLVAGATAALLAAYRRDFRLGVWLRLPVLLAALVATANLVPPAWTPARLMELEFRTQTGALIVLLVGLAFSPFLALLPPRIAAIVTSLPTAAGIILPIYGYLQVLPLLAELYRQPLSPAWGPWLTSLGLIVLALAHWLPQRPPVANPSPGA